MITVPDGFIDMHDSASVAKAVCWRITRKDGVVIRLTDWSQSVWIDSEEFEPIDTAGGAAQNSALRRDGSQREHNTGLGGVVSSSLLTVKDFKDGRFRGARVDVIRLDPRYPWIARQEKQMQITDLRFSEAGWFADVTSAAALAMRRKWGEKASSTCRNSLFDANCTRCSGLNCATPTLVKSHWQLGHAAGNYPRVSAVDSATNRIAFTLQVPRIEISAIDPGVNGSGVRTVSPHYFVGPSPTNVETARLPIIIRGNVGHDPGDINGTQFTYQQCGTQLLPTTGFTTVSAGSVLGYVQVEPPLGWFDFGEIEWMTGDNAGLREQIRSQAAFVANPTGGWAGTIDIILEAPVPNPVQVGDTCQLTTGCDKLPFTCAGKFKINTSVSEGNTVNFRGEPTIKGNQTLVDTPPSR